MAKTHFYQVGPVKIIVLTQLLQSFNNKAYKLFCLKILRKPIKYHLFLNQITESLSLAI